MPEPIIDDDDLDIEPTPAAAAPAQPAAAAPVAPAAPAEPAPVVPAQPAGPASAREWAKLHLGYEEDHADDGAMLQALIAGRRSAAERIQQLEADRLSWQRSQQPPAPAKPDPLAAFKSPEFDPRWLSMVEVDQVTKNIRSKPGVDPSIASKLMAAQQWQADFAQRITTDPIGALQPLIQHAAAELFEKQFSERFQGVQAQQENQAFIRDNFQWLFAHDSAGQPIKNPQSGGHVMTQEGQSFYRALQSAAQMQMPPAAQVEYARAIMARDLAMPHLQAAAAGQQGEAAKRALVDNLNRRKANRSGSTVADAGQPGAAQNKALPFAERLKQQFEAEGVTDADFAAV